MPHRKSGAEPANQEPANQEPANQQPRTKNQERGTNMNYLSQSWLIDRRHALRALGTFIALPMLECMIPLRATESDTATPRRSAFIYLANGVHSLNYQILTPGKDYQFSRSLAPLEKHRDVITPISGLHH